MQVFSWMTLACNKSAHIEMWETLWFVHVCLFGTLQMAADRERRKPENTTSKNGKFSIIFKSHTGCQFYFYSRSQRAHMALTDYF